MQSKEIECKRRIAETQFCGVTDRYNPEVFNR